MLRRPASARHHDRPSLYPINLPAPSVGNGHRLRRRRIAVMLHPDDRGIKPDARCRPSFVQLSEVHRPTTNRLHRVIPRNRFRNQCLRDQPRKPAISIRKHLVAGLVTDVERVQHVSGVSRIARERVRPQPISAAFQRRKKRANGVAADAMLLPQVVFERDRIQPA